MGYLIWLYMGIAFFSLCSCCHDDDDKKPEPDPNPIPPDTYADMTVTFDWSQCGDERPASMSLYLFNSQEQSIPVNFPNATGGKVQLLPDKYQALAYNNDTENLTGFGTSYEDFEISVASAELEGFARMFAQTRGNIPRAEDTENQPVVYEPDKLYIGNHIGHTFQTTADGLTLFMKPATFIYSITIKNVDNLSYVVEAAATISGMAMSMHPATALPTQTTAIIPFALQVEASSMLKGEMRCFGHCPEQTMKHYLVIYAMMDNGAKYYYTYDITDYLHAPGQPGSEVPGGTVDVNIEISNLPIPQPINGEGGGIKPQVDTWNEIEIPIEM